jgi:short-subunit dehydrogenase
LPGKTNVKQHIVITGASKGLGAALATGFAGEGVHLSLCARDISNVEALTKVLEAKGSTVNWASIDLRIAQQSIEWIDFISRSSPIDMLVLNAGIFDGSPAEGLLEDPQRAADIVSTNLLGSVVPALHCAQKMRDQERGHLVFISSLAGFAAHADAPTYSASKAAVSVFARALREELAPSQVGVSLFHPGHIDTAQTQQHIGALPGLVSVETAAKRIVDAVHRGPSETSFPMRFRLGLAVLNLLPWRVRARLNRAFRFKVRPPSSPNSD